MLHRRPLLLLLAAMSVLTLLPLTASAQTVTLTPATQTINFGIGCPPANPAGSCASVQYFLSRTPGSQSVGNLLTGSAWAQRQVNGRYVENTFNPDTTLDPVYILDASRNLTGQVQFGGFLAGTEYGLLASTKVEIRAHVVGTPGFQMVTLGSTEVSKTVVTPGDTTYAFSFDLPDSLDKVRIDRVEAVVGHDSATVLGNGFMNGQGGSFFRLPHFRETTS